VHALGGGPPEATTTVVPVAATAGDGRTVTSVAARWGFPSSARYTAQYRAAYGELPSQTLRD
jgi:AraC-like DNA-binding protein